MTLFNRRREEKEEGVLGEGRVKAWRRLIVYQKVHLFNSTADLQKNFPFLFPVALGKVAVTIVKGFYVCNLCIPF